MISEILWGLFSDSPVFYGNLHTVERFLRHLDAILKTCSRSGQSTAPIQAAEQQSWNCCENTDYRENLK